MDGSGGVAQWQCHGLEHILALFWLPLIGRSDADVRNCACPSVNSVGVSTVHSGEERERVEGFSREGMRMSLC